MTLGRTKSDRQGYFLSGNWAAVRQAEAERVRQLGGDEVSVEPPLHRHGRRGGADAAAGMVHGRRTRTATTRSRRRPGIVGSTTASYNWNSQTKDQTWMLGVGADWQAMDSAEADGVVPVRRRTRATRRSASQNDLGLNPPPAHHRQLRQQQAAVLQPEGHLDLQQELVVHRRLLVHEVQPRRHRHQRLPVRAAAYRRRGASSRRQQHVAELPQRLRRVHRRPLEHLLPVGDVQVRRAAAARRAAEGRRSAEAGAGRAAAAAAARSGARAGPRRRRRCRRSRSTRRCCSTSTRRC